MKKKSILILNSAPVRNDQFSNLICNLLPSNCRLDNLEGREHIVVPMVMLVEGVHNGSDGPFLYSHEELAKAPSAWDYKPVVVYHPEKNGQGVSACKPEILNSRKVGVVLNTKFEGGKLKAEAWIEKERANLIDDRIMTALQANEMMELSTGLFADFEDKTGEWKGESYNGIARNFRPDHLAILPDKIGACSINDGAGFLRNQKGEKGFLSKLMQRLIGNEMSFDNIRSQLCQSINEKYNIDPSKMNGPYVWVADVYPTFVVYEYDNKLFRLSYAATDTGVSLGKETPVEVKRVTEYRTVEGAFVGNQDQTQMLMNAEVKKSKIDALIANKESGWTEENRKSLDGMNEKQLCALEKGNTVPAPAKLTENSTPAPVVVAPVKPIEPAPVINQNKIVTIDEFINQAPDPAMRDFLRNGVQAQNEEKAKLVENLLANANNIFTKDDLGNRPLNELRALARLAGGVANPSQQIAPNYGGNAPIPTGNQASGDPLDLPVIDFTSK